MNEEEEWLRRLRETPADLDLRTAYGKWLSKCGQPGKADLIALAVEEAKLHRKRDDLAGSGLSENEWSRLRVMQERLLGLSYELDSSWIALIDPELAIPGGLADLGLRAAQTIIDFVGNEGWTYSGCGYAFSTPAEFFGDDTPFTRMAVLVVSHADGLLDECLGMDPRHDEIQNRLIDQLDKIGVWSELKDESNSIIFPSDYAGYSIGLG